MVSDFDGLVSVGVLVFCAVLAYLFVKSKEVRLVEPALVDETLVSLARQKKAREMLEAEGYRVLSKNRRVRCDMLLDEDVQAEDLYADFTVLKDGKYFVCKMRSEDEVKFPDHKELRDQLLPLQMLYRSSGCLYLDLVDEEVHVVSFGVHDRKGMILKWRKRLTWVAAGFLLAVMLQ